MAIDSLRLANQGVREVSKIVEDHWVSDFQELEAKNDDCYDALVFLRKKIKNKTLKTPGVISVQIKTGPSYKITAPGVLNHFAIKLGFRYIQNHRPMWEQTNGPAILVYVEPISLDKYNLYWINLKDPNIYSQTNRGALLINEKQKFGLHTKGDMKKLLGRVIHDQRLPEVHMDNEDFAHYTKLNYTHKELSREYYKAWAQAGSTSSEWGNITINRTGWRHLTRRSKAPLLIKSSLNLLPVARKIIDTTDKSTSLRQPRIYDISNYGRVIKDLLGLRAIVHFPNRNQCTVQVVLLRERFYSQSTGQESSKIKFLSVYEL